ncbi:MAG: CU044_2847 family protein [Cyanobacteria bacterium P01_E01_bin.45]
MTTKLIELSDGTFVEVEVRRDEVREISGGNAEKVEKSLRGLNDILRSACRPLVESLDLINQDAKDKNVSVEKLEAEIGLNFESEGNIYIVSSKGSASFKLNITIKPTN